MKRISLFLTFLLLMSSSYANARRLDPKTKGIGDGTGTGTTEGNVKLPIGLPFSVADGNATSGDESAAASRPANIVYTFDIPGEIGPEAFRQTKSALAEAKEMNAAYVLIHISSNSGMLDAAENIKNEIQNFDRPVLVYVDNKATPASELISMAGDSIYLRNGKNSMNSSHYRSKKGASALSSFNDLGVSGYSNVSSPNVSDERTCLNGSVRTVSFFSLNEGDAGMDEVLNHAGLENYQVVEFRESAVSKMIGWCLDPKVSFCLIIAFSFLLHKQRKSKFPGPVTFALFSLLPFILYPLYANGSASIWELTLLAAFCAGLLFLSMKKKYTGPIAIAGFILTLFLCKTEGAQMSSLTFDATLLLLSSSAVLAGWYLNSALHYIASLRLRSIRSLKATS